MLDTFDVPADDLFQVLSESGPSTELVRPEQYLGIKYSDDLTFIQVTCNDTRTVDQKKALYSAIADNPQRSLITLQVEMGVAVRMACLDVLTRRERGIEGWA
jgi:hypothetical protein